MEEVEIEGVGHWICLNGGKVYKQGTTKDFGILGKDAHFRVCFRFRRRLVVAYKMCASACRNEWNEESINHVLNRSELVGEKSVPRASPSQLCPFFSSSHLVGSGHHMIFSWSKCFERL